MWYLPIQSNMLNSLAINNFSDDISIVGDYDVTGEVELYYLTSPHLKEYDLENHELAYYRAKALIRLLNSIILLTNNYAIDYNSRILFEDKHGIRPVPPRKNDFTIVEYNQLFSPFSNLMFEQSSTLSTNYIGDFISLAKEEDIVLETLMFFSLSTLDVLYFFINVYKIYENITYNLEIPKNKNAYNKIRDNLDPDLRKYLDFFLLGSFSQFANSKEGTGIFSRHGESHVPYDKEALDFNEIDYNIRNLIIAWLNDKLRAKKGRYYKITYNKRPVEAMRDSDYEF
ncbi:hypothetical protein [Bacillus suaedae]|uniref:Uncharacterized protein n=1 Tax=Halalkalibacter suaedae TaxID=2822140 RepID=A0A941ASY9_9BACI|nr:hypothetical protein [Bacillus suaedae]MBP3950354.1 hypothetical protein [Bacillus suaedae]